MVIYLTMTQAITIPEAFNPKAYPVTVGIYGLENTTDTKFFDELEDAVVLETIDSAIPPTSFPSQVSGTVTTSWTDAGEVSFTSLTDTIHTAAPSCFSAVSTSACDCGPLDGTITAGGSSCVVAGTTVTLQNMATVDAAGASLAVYQSLLELEGDMIPGPTYTPTTATAAQLGATTMVTATTASSTTPPPAFSATITYSLFPYYFTFCVLHSSTKLPASERKREWLMSNTEQRSFLQVKSPQSSHTAPATTTILISQAAVPARTPLLPRKCCSPQMCHSGALTIGKPPLAVAASCTFNRPYHAGPIREDTNMITLIERVVMGLEA